MTVSRRELVAPVFLPFRGRVFGVLPAVGRQRAPDVDLVAGEAALLVASDVARIPGPAGSGVNPLPLAGGPARGH